MADCPDAAGNLNFRTNNALVQTLNADSRNQLTTGSRSGTFTAAGSSSSGATSVTVNSSAADRYADSTFAREGFTLADGSNTFTAVASDGSGRQDTQAITAYLPVNVTYAYDSNGNLTSDGLRSFEYDDENQLTAVYVAGSWTNRFSYDGKRRLRIKKEYKAGITTPTNEARYIYDGMLPVQERNAFNLPGVTLTRGLDLSGSIDGAGGIGGLLARTDQSAPIASHAFYHADRNGNVTCLINPDQAKVGQYLYDPFGKVLAASGTLAEANRYQFSSKEFQSASGLSYFGYRFYDPSLQRWLNRDPSGTKDGPNFYAFVHNGPLSATDAWALNSDDDEDSWSGWVDIGSKLGFCPDSIMQGRYPVAFIGTDGAQAGGPSGSPGGGGDGGPGSGGDGLGSGAGFAGPGNNGGEPSTGFIHADQAWGGRPMPIGGGVYLDPLYGGRQFGGSTDVAAIDTPLDGLLQRWLGGGAPARIGPALEAALKRARRRRPWPTVPTVPTGCPNLHIGDYYSVMHPFDSIRIGLTLGQFRYTDDGKTTSISDLYDYPWTSPNWTTGGTDAHNRHLSWIPGQPYPVFGSWASPQNLSK